MSITKEKIFIILPVISQGPVGGYKVIFQYANLMVDDGYDVTIAYARFIWKYFIKRDIIGKLAYLKNCILGCKKYSARNWFPLDERIHEIYPFSLTSHKFFYADIYIATACLTVKYLAHYPTDKKKFYFIQGYETWDMNDKELEDTYALPYKKIVVSLWLQQLLSHKGFHSTLIYNGFNNKEFYVTQEIENKDKTKISILYHPDKLKGFFLALEALTLVRQEVSIVVEAFGSQYPTISLPSWVRFHLSPMPDEHLFINNECAIYIAASYFEGWGLTIGEAMMCGQAIVCTNNKGYLEMATNNHNALVSPVGDADALAQSVIKLISNDQLRYKIAHQGLNDIKAFNIENSYTNLINCLFSS